METRLPAARQSHWRTGGLWGEVPGPWAGEPGTKVRTRGGRVSGPYETTILSPCGPVSSLAELSRPPGLRTLICDNSALDA
ncbi:Keratin, Type Ii Cytoskeletal 78, partial [Manis pentadactyla]